ncbi:class I SAM-dependent methyltransferase [Methanocella sp. CWC-04]|uniref:Class I SAM-dependent methyltransferase n=1 Tax=Methanooceanicella nereidis TaxID=2052831 RepID=A0AAP2RCY5_9EURY|nr:class I SAM-dependent methyltransferase [Methanocella sp. CWC-04]MCD1294350.1 class I SAM-dependent methyltransferase [Methanocella sp. CWC-04]
MITDDFDYLAPGGRSFTITSGLISKLNKRSRVLEIASGRGEAACALAGEFGCRVEGFDLDPNMVEYSRQKAEALGIPDLVSFDVIDGRDLDFGKGKYNLILAEGGALTYIGREDGVEKCAELLKDNGYLALTDLIYIKVDVDKRVRDVYEEGVYSYLNEIDYRKLLERNGLEIIHLSMVPQSAWDRYYISMRRKISSRLCKFTQEFKDAMANEIDVYYNWGGMESVGYVYIVAKKIPHDRRLAAGPEDLRISTVGSGYYQ